ncbi:MAG: flagellin [Oscillibacter sp.]|nr:flagellin [Oscillibacter sp.]
MRVQHNISAMNAYRNYNVNTSMINKNLEKLSSGYKINRAGDDAAGLAISEKMRAQITGIEVAQKNAKDGISLVQTAEGALTEVHSMLNRMYQLAEQSANGTYQSNLDREQLNKEVGKLKEEIDRIGATANFNGISLFAQGGVSGTIDTENSTDWAASLSPTFEWAEGADTATVQGDIKAMTADDGDPAQVKITFAKSGSDPATATVSWANALKDADGTNYAISGSYADDKATVDIKSGGNTVLTMTLDLSGKSPANSDEIYVDLKASGSGGGASEPYTAPTDLSTPMSTQTAPTLLSQDEKITKGGINLWVGDSTDKNNIIHLDAMLMNTEELKIDKIDISSQEGALDSLDFIKNAIDKVSDMRGDLGAVQNRLEHTINNLSVMQENMQDAESTIRDTDVASEMMKYTKNSILIQSSQAMLAQANQQPQGVLQLLQ